ncbi:membrane or secreted protein [Flavobacteriaceae bacterium AU392]|nr:membrane or secreted protein [Flavobacteriaceae bacterium]RKM85718.1 membrane or secreted protein [Flavobacteriaceae bacterium AU392]
MRKLFFLLIFIISFGAKAQSLIGAWEAYTTSKNGESIRNVIIFSEGYQVATWYHAKTGKFIMSNGGKWKMSENTITEKVEFDTNNSERVGSEVSFKIYIDDTTLGIVGDTLKWNRIDEGNPGKLQGAWLMSGRIRDGKTQLRDVNRPRKTMKIMSGTRFQWIAYNTETKQFMGTGGGTYSTVDGEYTENIEFFSRDNSKTGLSLKFNYSLIDGKWHHSGFSSKGDRIHEIWSLRE